MVIVSADFTPLTPCRQDKSALASLSSTSNETAPWVADLARQRQQAPAVGGHRTGLQFVAAGECGVGPAELLPRPRLQHLQAPGRDIDGALGRGRAVDQADADRPAIDGVFDIGGLPIEVKIHLALRIAVERIAGFSFRARGGRGKGGTVAGLGLIA